MHPMKILFFLSLVFGLSSLRAQVPTSAELAPLLHAIAQVESSGRPNAINKPEKALGLYQIRPVAVAEYTRLTGKPFEHNDALNPVKARVLVEGLLQAYARYMTKQGHPVTPQSLARCWNGGIMAYLPQKNAKETNLNLYWSKVQRHLTR